MGQPTEYTVYTVRNTRRGSDYYGACEVCGGTYGHMDCLIGRFGNLVSEGSLQRGRNVLLFPQWSADNLMAEHGNKDAAHWDGAPRGEA